MVENLVVAGRKYSVRRYTLGEYKGQVSGVDVEESLIVNHQIVNYINKYELTQMRDWLTELLKGDSE